MKRFRIQTALLPLVVVLTVGFLSATAQVPIPVADQPLPYNQAPLPDLPAPAAADAAAFEAWIQQVEGGWYGENNQTPMGRMPFALLFDREEGGSLYTHAALNRETWIDLRFIPHPSGNWLLQEGAALEGLGERGSVLIPAERRGALRRWVHPENPDYLAVEMSVDEATLYMNIRVLGREHATFRLRRATGEESVAMREQFHAGSERTPAEASIYDQLGGGEIPEAILAARAKLAVHPDDARAQLALAQAVSDTIRTDPAQAPKYAFEMLQSLERALELDPSIPETYEYLAGYYLNAPPIAGGSVDKAEGMARKLASLDAARGERLLAQVRTRRGGAE